MSENKIHGTTERCLISFSEENGFRNANREGCIIRNKVCMFLGIASSTGHDWFDECIMPKGVNYLKLQAFLELMGYHTKERMILNDLQKRIGDCLAFSNVTANDFGDLVSVNQNAVLRWAMGATVPLDENKAEIETALKLYEEYVREKRMMWQEKIREIGLKSPHKFSVQSKDRVSDIPENISHDKVVEKVAELVSVIEPLARRLVSSEFSPEERKRLRELTTLPDRSHKVFELSNHLNRLCGERARNDLR